MARIWIREIAFNDKTEIELGKNDIVVFVGPNNVGKSVTLKDLAFLLRDNDRRRSKVIANINLEKEGTLDNVLDLLKSASLMDYAGNPEPSYRGIGYNIYLPNLEKLWDRGIERGFRDLAPFFVSILDTEERLKITQPPRNIKFRTEPVEHPIHLLKRDRKTEETFSDYFRQAFGIDLVIDHGAGGEVPIHVGQRPELRDGEDRVDLRYVEEVEGMDLLHEQGDGMRSYVGVLLHAFVAAHSVILIDEPEAFLHPPQARLLGKVLAKDLPAERQVFLATHSEDFLKGLLDADSNRIKIVRLTRDGTTNNASVLNSDEIRNLWADPLLRHSNVLSGIFHSKVIVCESEGDSRFYHAVLSASFDGTERIAPDVLFINCNGKHRIPTVIGALNRLNVTIRIVADFDVLNAEQPLRNVFEGLGGTWTGVEQDWRRVKTAIEAKKPELEADDVKKQVYAILEAVSDRAFPTEAAESIRRIIKKSSAWSEAKTVGKAFVPSGEPTQAFDRLNAAFEEKGLFVVPCGELEGFARSIGNKGPKWVNEVLLKNLKDDAELADARAFVERINS